MKYEMFAGKGRRRFLRNVVLAAAGILLVFRTGARKKEISPAVIGCAPSPVDQSAGTVTSVQSGNWSDPATWGGRLPAAADTPVIAAGHVVVYDVAAGTVAGVVVGNGGTLAFDTGRSATLQSTANVVVEGALRMRPKDITIIHTLKFTGIDESRFTGGGMHVLDTDTGLWVMGSGVLDLEGTARTSWTRVKGGIAAGAGSITVNNAAGWKAGDEISIAPTLPPTAGSGFLHFDETRIKSINDTSVALNNSTQKAHPEVNGQWTAEVMNLTRNVRIEGTPSGRSHIFLRSSGRHTVKYVAIRYMGPRKDRNGDGVRELVAGRYGLHFHHCNEGSRGSLVEGCVIRDTGNHSYVPHTSHGITMRDNIAYNVTEIAFWWDPGDLTHDVLYDHNIVAICNFVRGSLDMNAEDAPTFSSSGFLMTTGDDNVCINNVVVGGGLGDVANGGAYNWEATLNEGVWIFHDNMAHNNDNGLRVWQNSTRNHVVNSFTAYHNGVGIFHGAYANSYTYNGGILYGNGIQVKAASVNTSRVRFENIIIDAAGITGFCIRVLESPLDGAVPVFLRNLTLRGYKAAAISDESPEFLKCIDVIGCTIEGPTPYYIHPGASAREVIRVQTMEGRPIKITKAGTSNIAPFAPVVWGAGDGLKGEYYNGSAFTSHAFTRIDSNVSFSEWSAGVHHKITGNAYSIRWTGQVQPQYSEAYTFYLGSAGGHRLWVDDRLMLDSWQEHFPGGYPSASIMLEAGKRYNIRLEYFNTDSNTGMGLSWKSSSQPLEYIPQSQLYSTDCGQ